MAREGHRPQKGTRHGNGVPAAGETRGTEPGRRGLQGAQHPESLLRNLDGEVRVSTQGQGDSQLHTGGSGAAV